MKKIFPLLLSILFLACKKTSIQESDLHYLNGYWEISEVIFPDGSIKEYGMNPSIDFIQLEDGEGFRKKLKPNFNGTYDTSNHDVETLKVIPNNQTVILSYDNEFSHWEEKLMKLDSLSFTVINDEGISYSYKRFEPIKIPK